MTGRRIITLALVGAHCERTTMTETWHDRDTEHNRYHHPEQETPTMTTAMHTETQNVPTVTYEGRSIIIRRTPSYGRSVVGYIDPPDAERACSTIRGALADAYTAGYNRARIDVLNIMNACTDHDDDDAINEADHLDRDERAEAHNLRAVIDQLTDTLEEWTGQ